MLDTSMWSDSISWRTVDKKFDSKTDFSMKREKKIKRRTKVLNRELKKFAGLKTYSQYVRAKTAILRNISDNEDTEDEEPSMSSESLPLLSSLYNSDEESSLDIFSQSLTLLPDDISHLPSRKIKSAQHRQTHDDVSKSNLSRSVRFKNNKIFVGGEKCNIINDDTNTEEEEEGGKDEENVGKLRECSSARRNLTLLLESMDNDSIKDDANNNANDKVNNNNNNNTNSQSDENSRQIVQMTIVQPSDSGIDDDSQDNLSMNIRKNEIIPHDEQNGDSHENLQAISEVSLSHNVDVNEDKLSETTNEKEAILTDYEMQPKKSQPMITRTELVKSKYTIIRDENETWNERDNNDLSSQNSINEHEIINDKELKIISPEPEPRRIIQMKRINLMCSGTESDSSQDEIIVQRAYSQGTSNLSDFNESVVSMEIDPFDHSVSSTSPMLQSGMKTLCTQQNIKSIIGHEKKSIKSQIEEQKTDDENSPNVERKINKESDEKLIVCETVAADIPSPSSSPRRRRRRRRSSISETFNEQAGTSREDFTHNTIRKKKATMIGPTDADSLQYVLNNLCTRSNDEADDLSYPNGICNNDSNSNNENKTGQDPDFDETLSKRPIELRDFIQRQGLLPSCELSTITIDDVTKSTTNKDEDNEIWLIEIPRMIARDPELCGKSISLEKTSMTIGKTRYDITRRHEKLVSFIFQTGSKKKTRYKTVNMRPVGSIVVRHESTERGISGLYEEKQHHTNDVVSIAETDKIVPFPKNLKSRDPLMPQRETIANDDEKMVLPSNKTRRKIKTRRNRLWQIENFILKSKKRKRNFP